MGRTNVVLDERRVRELQQLTGSRTKAQAVRDAVEAAIRRAKVVRLQSDRRPILIEPTDRGAEERRRRRRA